MRRPIENQFRDVHVLIPREKPAEIHLQSFLQHRARSIPIGPDTRRQILQERLQDPIQTDDPAPRHEIHEQLREQLGGSPEERDGEFGERRDPPRLLRGDRGIEEGLPVFAQQPAQLLAVHALEDLLSPRVVAALDVQHREPQRLLRDLRGVAETEPEGRSGR